MSFFNRTWKVGGIDSVESASHLHNTLCDMESISDVHVDLVQKKLEFTFNPEAIDEQFIKNTINSLGYSFQGSIDK